MNAPIPVTAVAVPTIAVDAIVASPSNPRKSFDETYLAELAESIKEHGLIQPITVRPLPLDHFFKFNQQNPDRDPSSLTPSFEIVVGECRWRAAKLAGLTEIPAFWRELDDKQVLEIQVIENLQRRDVHPIEEADGYLQLMRVHGYTADEIAEKIGKSRSYVYARTKLAALSQPARAIIFSEKIDASIALLIARISDEAAQVKALKDLRNQAGANNEVSFRDAKWLLRHGFQRNLDIAIFSTEDASLLPKIGSCTACQKRSGNSPEICPDIDGPDVCTDVKCFAAKDSAHRTQQINATKKRGIKVYTGDAVKEFAEHGTAWSIDRDKWVVLDEEIGDDMQNRTYRMVLGDATPVAAAIEVKTNNGLQLIELGEPTAIEEALREAGYKPAFSDDADENESPATATRGAQSQNSAERETNLKKVEDEKVNRKALQNAIVDHLLATTSVPNPSRLIVALAIAHLAQVVSYSEVNEETLARLGIEVPAEFDENELLAKAREAMATWPINKALAYLALEVTHQDATDFFDWRDKTLHPATDLQAIADAIGLSEPKPLPELNPAPAWPFPVADKEADATTADASLKVGDRVRIKEGVKGPNRHIRKVCGRDGVIDSESNGRFVIRLGPGRNGLANDFGAEDLTRLATGE